MNSGMLEIDVHQMNRLQAKNYINAQLKKVPKDIYVLRVVHGYNSGTKLRDMIRKEYKNNPKVIRMELSMNPGVTDLILRDLF